MPLAGQPPGAAIAGEGRTRLKRLSGFSMIYVIFEGRGGYLLLGPEHGYWSA